jgi:hypothetical protein
LKEKNRLDNKKTSGLFMKACLVIAALWLVTVAAVVVYFHAIGRPLDPTVAAFLFSPGIGELGFSSLVKAAKEKGGGEAAETELAALRAELEALKPKPSKRAVSPAQETPKAAPAPREQKQARAMLEQMLPSLVFEAERAYGAGTGPLKLSFVMEKVYARLPDAYKMLFTTDQLGGMVDKALAVAKELWIRNPALVGGAETG